MYLLYLVHDEYHDSSTFKVVSTFDTREMAQDYINKQFVDKSPMDYHYKFKDYPWYNGYVIKELPNGIPHNLN